MHSVPNGPDFRWLASPDAVGSATRRELVACWRDVSNAGGAVGFPFPPVGDEHVAPAVEELVESLAPGRNRLLLAAVTGELAGWLLVAGNEHELIGHWATVRRVQTAPAFRGSGIGRAMMDETARAAREDFGLEHLHLAVRAVAAPSVRPVCFLWEDGAFWWITGAYARLPRLLARDPRVSLVIDTCDLESGEVRQVTARGEAEVVDFDRERARRKLTRYLGPDESEWDTRFSVRYLEQPDQETRLVRLVPERMTARDPSFSPSS